MGDLIWHSLLKDFIVSCYVTSLLGSRVLSILSLSVPSVLLLKTCSLRPSVSISMQFLSVLWLLISYSHVQTIQTRLETFVCICHVSPNPATVQSYLSLQFLEKPLTSMVLWIFFLLFLLSYSSISFSLLCLFSQGLACPSQLCSSFKSFFFVHSIQ